MEVSPLTQYLEEIGQYELLSFEEELELGQRIKEGDTIAITKLANHNLRLVVFFAKRYTRNNNLMDLIQEGNIGLMKAVTRYDPDRGHRFSTYAAFWVRQKILRYLMEDRTIRLPENASIDIKRLKDARNTLQSKLNRDPSLEEIAEEAEIAFTRAQNLWGHMQSVASLDSAIGEDNDTDSLNRYDGIIDDRHHDVVDCIDLMMDFEQVEKAINSIPEREKFVLSRRFGLYDYHPHTLDEIARALEISRERVRQIEIQAINRVRKHCKGRIVSFNDEKRAKRSQQMDEKET